MRGYKFLFEVEGLDHPVWQYGYGDGEAECRRDAEARIEEAYGGRAIRSWAHRRLDGEELPPALDDPEPELAATEPPARDELYWHMEVDAWLAQLSAIRSLPEPNPRGLIRDDQCDGDRPPSVAEHELGV